MLKIENLKKNYGNLEALKNINLDIEEGEFFGLLGPNGAGKTTLMNIIIGFLNSDSGKIFFNDKVISNHINSSKKDIGYVPQEISLYQELSAEQNLKIFGKLFDLSGNFLKQKIDEVLDLVELKERKKDSVKDFSGGMKRRLNIAASLLHNPKLILCDEPTVGVDPQSRNAIFDLLLQLNSEGKTVIYTTHYMEEAERLCDRLAVIDHGEIRAIGNLTSLINLIDVKDKLRIIKNSDTEKFISDLKSFGEIYENENHFEVIPNKDYSKLSKLFTDLEKIGFPEEFVAIKKASLEDVFLHLTGRSLRD